LADEEFEEREAYNKIYDQQLNEITSQVMSRAFMVMGVFLFIALGAAVLGTLRQQEGEFVYSSTKSDRRTRVMLAGYNNWTSVSSECCCMPSIHPPKGMNITERWVCPRTKLTMTRARMTDNARYNGLVLRDMCSRTFTPSCEVVVYEGLSWLFCRNTTLYQTNLPRTFHQFW
jgi:hypothetical protein